MVANMSYFDKHKKRKKQKRYLRRKQGRKHKASEGLTSAIILIAFIITASGIAFVILTIGQSMQIELGNVGEQGKNAASSAMSIDGGIVSGYVGDPKGTTENVTAYIFNLRLVLSSGKVDLTNSSIECWIMVGNAEEARLSYQYGLDISTATSNNDNEYYIDFLDANSNTVLEANEIGRFYISSTTALGAQSSQEVTIIINSGSATMRIEKTIPPGLQTGCNLL